MLLVKSSRVVSSKNPQPLTKALSTSVSRKKFTFVDVSIYHLALQKKDHNCKAVERLLLVGVVSQIKFCLCLLTLSVSPTFRWQDDQLVNTI